MHDIDRLFQSLIFSYYQNAFSLPKKIVLNIKPSNLPLIKQAVRLKFEAMETIEKIDHNKVLTDYIDSQKKRIKRMKDKQKKTS